MPNKRLQIFKPIGAFALPVTAGGTLTGFDMGRGWQEKAEAVYKFKKYNFPTETNSVGTGTAPLTKN